MRILSVVMLLLCCTFSRLTCGEELPLIRLGAGDSGADGGSLQKIQIELGGNASVASAGEGMILGPLAESDNSGTVVLTGDGVWPEREFTVTAWVRLPMFGYEGNGVCLFDAYDAATCRGVQCNLSFGTNREIRLYTVINGKAEFTPYFRSRVVSGAAPEWFWIAVRFDGAVLVAAKGTRNGEFELSPVVRYFDSPQAIGPASTVTLGYRNNTGNRAFKGNLMDFRIYDRVLRMEELQQVMKENKFNDGGRVPDMDAVLLTGDSIRMAYAPSVREVLKKEELFVCWPGENCEDSRHLLEKMPAYLEEFHPRLVVWNAGLHDIKSRRPDGVKQISFEEYRENLEKIATLLKQAKISSIFALTTPVIAERHNPIQAFDRSDDDVLRCNEIAREVMKEYSIPVVDLYSLIAPERERLLKPDGVHPTVDGAEILAAAVTAAVKSSSEVK